MIYLLILFLTLSFVLGNSLGTDQTKKRCAKYVKTIVDNMTDEKSKEVFHQTCLKTQVDIILEMKAYKEKWRLK